MLRTLMYLCSVIALCFVCSTDGYAKKKSGKVKKGKRGAYPLKVNARPLVLPKGMGEARGSLAFSNLSIGKESVNSLALGGGFAYGVMKGLELGGVTGINLSPEVDWSSSLTLRGGYRVYNKKRRGLSVAAQIDLPLTFGEGQDVLSSTSLGMATRYRINKKVALHSGEGLIQLGFGEEITTRINVPIGVAFQVNRRLNLRLDTRLASMGSGDTVSLDQSIPLGLRGIYAIKRMIDVGASLNTDLVSDGPLVVMGLFAYRIR